jgi:hypothetical protein
MFDKPWDQINNLSWDKPHVFGYEVHFSKPQTSSSGKFKCTGEHFSWYGSNGSRAMVEPPSCQQYKPGDFLPVRPMNCDEILDEDNDGENWAAPEAPSGLRSCRSDGNDNDHSEYEEHTDEGANGTGKEKGTKVAMGKGHGKGTVMEHGKG